MFWTRARKLLAQRWKSLIFIAILAGGTVFYALYWQVDRAAWQAWAQHLHGGVLFALITLLPLVGFSSSILQVLAGARFGGEVGVVVVAVAILLQIFAAYAIVHVLRKSFERRLRRIRERIPRDAHVPMTLFTVLLPGVPYFVKNYALPLVGVPLRISLLVAWPLHIIRATVAVLLGGQSTHFTWERFAVLVVYGLAIALAGFWAFRRLQARMAAPADARR